MITYADLRNNLFKIWTARIWIDGQPYTIVNGLPTRSLSALRPRSTCSVELQTLPPSTADLPAVVEIVMDGKTEVFFTGKTAQRSATSEAYSRSANLIDLMNLDRALPSNITWDDRSFVDAAKDLLYAAGLTDASIDEVFNPGSGYNLGSNYSITLKKGENIGQLLSELMNYGGTAYYTTSSGRVRVVDSPGIPSSVSNIIYANGADLAAGEFPITNAGYSLEGNEAVVAQFTAYGPKRPDGAIPDGTFNATGISGKAERVSYRWLQNDTLAQTIASRELSRRARSRVNVWFEAPLNPLLEPGNTILLRDPNIGYPTNQPAAVVDVSTTADAGMRVQVSIGASLVDGYSTSIKPPRVDFSMTVEQQQLILAGSPVSRYFVQCRNTSRDDNGYAITAITWSATGVGVIPASDIAWTTSEEVPTPPPAAAQPMFFFEDLTGAEITLTVTSESGESATITKTPVALETQVFNRILATAGEAGWGVLTLTGWRYFDAGSGASCTAVPAINDVGPMYSGWDNGAIYVSTDALVTTPTLLTTLSGGAIGCLWINEGNKNYLLAGNGNILSRSTNAGVTWETLHDFGDAVLDVQNSPSNPNEIRVCAGANQWITYDGSTWAILTPGPEGSFAMMGAYAPWGHAVAFDGVSSEADSLHFEEGYAVDWTTIPEEDRPSTGLLSVTPMLGEEAFIAGAGAITDLVRDGVLDALVFAASGGGGNIYKLLWNGTYFVSSLLLSSLDLGPLKLINQLETYPIDLLGATQIGYGSLGTYLTPMIIRLPYKASGAGDYIWRLRDGIWEGITPPQPGWAWLDLSVSPVNPQQWLLLGNTAAASVALKFDTMGGLVKANGTSYSPLWYSADAGATWSQVTLAHPYAPDYSAGSNSYAIIFRTTWAQSGTWAVISASDNLGVVGNSTTWWFGVGGSTVSGGYYDASDHPYAQEGALAEGGEIVVYVEFGAPHGVRYAPYGSSGPLTRPSGTVSDYGRVGLQNAGRGIIIASLTGGPVAGTPDYRAAQPSTWSGAPYGSFVAPLDGAWLIGGSSIVFLDEYAGPGTVEYTGTVIALATDRQTRTIAAAVLNDGTMIVRDTTGVWSVIPTPTAATTMAPYVEVIGV